MIIKDIIKLVANILMRDDLVNVLNETEVATNEQTDDINFILSIVNLVNNTIATDYIKLKETVNVSCVNGKVEYENITNKNILDIIKVKDKLGNNVDFKTDFDGLILPNGEYKVSFAYFPETKSLTDSITEYKLHMTERVFCYGVLSEYYLIKGNSEEASVWDDRFKQALLSVKRNLKSIIMPERRWK